MPRDSAVTVRAVEAEAAAREMADRLIGLFEGGPVPSDQDFAYARRLLWGSLGKRGSLTVESAGRGATFRLVLPMRAARVAAAS